MSHFIYHDLGRIEGTGTPDDCFQRLVGSESTRQDRGKPVVFLRTSAGTDYWKKW